MRSTNVVKGDRAERRRLLPWAAAVAALCIGHGTAGAQTPNDKRADAVRPGAAARTAAGGTAEESSAHKYFTDVMLVNQDGAKMRLYSDLIRGRVVIINSFFATCQGSCLPMNRNLEKVQQALGGRVGKDVNIISISVDPTVDTPASLKAYAQKLHARPGWYFMSGDEESVAFALKKLGQFVSDKQDHSNIFIIGNDRTGLWKKAFGLAQSDELVKIIESVLEDRPASER